MKGQVRAAVVAGLASLGVSACCVLPMVVLLLGLGGSWLAVFGKISAASYYVLGLSTLLIALAWIASLQHGRSTGMRGWLAVSTILVGAAWLVVFNEGRINEALMTLM
jgi:uncharacterized membrane protein YkgB